MVFKTKNKILDAKHIKFVMLPLNLFQMLPSNLFQWGVIMQRNRKSYNRLALPINLFFISFLCYFFVFNMPVLDYPQISAGTEKNIKHENKFLLPLRQARAAAPNSESNYIFCPITCQQHEELYLCSPPKTGSDVKEIQKQLNELGYFKGIANGIFNEATEQAVKKFQKDHGLKPDGVVKAETWHALSEKIEEPVTKEKIPPPPGEVVLIIDIINRKLTVYSDGEPYKQFPVAVGKNETRTPVGNWKVLRKALNWGNGFGSRWIGLTIPWGIYGIHGTNKPYSIGSYASHGCIRMFNNHVEQLYPWVEAGTPVFIAGNPFANPGHPHRVLRHGDKGADVIEVQRNLKRLGYYKGEIDGIFGGGMQKAVIEFRKDHNLRYDNCVDEDFYKKLGL